MTEKEKMLLGKPYDPADEELFLLRQKCHNLCTEYNQLKENDPRREQIIEELGIKHGRFFLQGPIFFDYGCFTSFGDGSYANYNLTVLDVCPVTIGNNVFFGPNVSIVTPIHPMHYLDRNQYFDEEKKVWTDSEYAAPITIKDNCWIASNVVICGGVTIGSGCVIGAGSVVTRSIPDNSLAFGNPCRVIRKIDQKDRENFAKLIK